MVIFFFFKQKTAYEMRISDWSSDVCSSDLAIQTRRTALCANPRTRDAVPTRRPALGRTDRLRPGPGAKLAADGVRRATDHRRAVERSGLAEIGRASCRERVCQSV